METNQSRPRNRQSIYITGALQSLLIAAMRRKREEAVASAERLRGDLSSRTVLSILNEKSIGKSFDRRSVYLVTDDLGIPRAKVLAAIQRSEAARRAMLAPTARDSRDATDVLNLELRQLNREMTAHFPTLFAKRLTTAVQKRAALGEYRCLLDSLKSIEAGKIPLRLDTLGYFNYLLDLAKPKGEMKEIIRIFALLTNLEVSRQLPTLELHRNAFQRLVTAVTNRTIEFEYIAFVGSRDSIGEEAALRLLHLYGPHASSVYVLFQNETSVTSSDTSSTIALLQNAECVLTHSWGHQG